MQKTFIRSNLFSSFKNISKTLLAGAVSALLIVGCDGNPESNASSNATPEENTKPGYDLSAIDHDQLAQEAAFGSDSLSASTNFSERVEDKSEKASGLAGAAFVAPPKISNYGTVTLNYEVDVPKGRANMEPAVGLSYASTSGDGLLGIGWSLKAGLGSIVRVTKNGPLFYDQRDTFEYNGKRLVKVSGPSDSEDGTYRQEIESDFVKLELNNSDNGGVWKVTDKAGTITWFGQTLNSRVYIPTEPTKTYTWKFNSAQDLNGNTMSATYDASDYKTNHLSYLQEIRYTGNTNAGLPANQFVRFDYKSRPDPYISKTAGFIMRMDRLLDTITVGWDDPDGSDNITLWDYQMVYETSKDSNRPLLKTVVSSHESTRPDFRYLKGTHSLVWKQAVNPDYDAYQDINPEQVQYFEGDFNGDGISDMVFFNPETGLWRAAEAKRAGGYTFKTYGQRFQGYRTKDQIQWFKGNAVGDYNGDGKADIAFFLPQTREFWVAEHNGEIFEFKHYGMLNIPNLNLFKCEWFAGDYDGNGLSDNVLFDETTGSWILMRNQGGRFEFIKFSQHFKNLFRDDYFPDHNLDSPNTLDASEKGKDYTKIRFFSGDYNGDGRTDIGIYDHRNGKWYVAENYRDPMAIFNLEWKLYKVFNTPEQALFSYKVFSGDYNGDGLSDFLIYHPEKKEWILGATGDQTVTFRIISRMPPSVGGVTRWLNGDFNGDGRTDVSFYSRDDNKLWVGESIPSGFRYRVYGSLDAGLAPDSETVLQTPLPKDEVKLKAAQTVTHNTTRTDLLSYEYNANPYGVSAEQPFLGYFNTDEKPTLVLYDQGKQSFYEFDPTKPDDTDKRVLIADNIDLSSDTETLLNFERPIRYLGKDALLYHQTQTNYTGTYQTFHLVQTGAPVQMVAKAQVTNFKIKDSLVLTGQFAEAANQSILLLDDQAPKLENTKFYLYKHDTPETAIPLNIEETSDLRKQDFHHLFRLGNQGINRINRKQFQFFVGKFTDGELASILMVDKRDGINQWYLGTLNLQTKFIKFMKLVNGYSADLPNQGFDEKYLVKPDGTILIATTNIGGLRFHRYNLSGNTITGYNYPIISSEYSFDFRFDKDLNPVLTKEKIRYTLTLSVTGQQLKTLVANPTLKIYQQKISRPDLIKAMYPYRWIQGDYNGDNKTDIGIFHLGEPVWYFANTTGMVSDLIHEVDNGIGGSYQISYINSTTLDNTGTDNIPDLSLNYKVCNELRIFDGLTNEIITRYEYKDGSSFSAFINGKKETDYFGFSTFIVKDALGSKSVNNYYSMPYEDYRKNRALAGALKENYFLGADAKLYSKAQHLYTLHEIAENVSQKPSFLIEPTSLKKFVRDFQTGLLTPYSETISQIVLTPNQYQMESETASVTDFYNDAVHQTTTVSTYKEYESIPNTNETRIALKKSFHGTDLEATTTYTYDAQGNLDQEITSYTGADLEIPDNKVIDYDHDVYGNVIRVSDLSGIPSRINETDFDLKLHQFVAAERSLKQTGHLETRYEINYGSAFGSTSLTIDANNNSHYLIYDELGRLIREDADTETGIETLTTYFYDNSFPLSAKTKQHAGNGYLVETRVYIDGMGRELHTVQSALGQAGKGYTRSGKKVWDAVGRLIRQSQPDWAADDEINTFRYITSEKHPTIFEYDASGRKKRVISPEAYPGEPTTTVEYNYDDPWSVTKTHSIGRGKTTVKNARGQVLYVTDFGEGDNGASLEAKMGFAYDLAGNRIKKMDLNSTTMDLTVDPLSFDPAYRDTSGHNIVTFKYDGFGRLTHNYDPDRGYSNHQYNAFGDKTGFTDALNRTTTFQYDRLGRLVQKNLPGLEGTVIYTFDELAEGTNLKGRLAALDDPAQRKIFSYDKLGRRTLEKRTYKDTSTLELSKVYETTFQYDLLDRVTRIVYPKDPRRNTSVTVDYVYNGMSLVDQVNAHTTEGWRPIISGITYNPFKQFDSISRANGVRTDYTYDHKRRLKRLVSLRNDDTNRRLQDVAYEFDTYDNIKSIINNPTEAVTNGHTGQTEMHYLYDGLNRLIDAEGLFDPVFGPSDPTTDAKKFRRYYNYALNGNLTRKDIVNPDDYVIEDRWDYTYDNHQAKTIETTQYGVNRFVMQYDAVGNITSQVDEGKSKSKQMVYSSENRITVVTDLVGAEVIGRYVYDDQGFRVYRSAKHLNEQGQKTNFEVAYPNKYLSYELQTTDAGVEVAGTWAVANHVYLNGVRVAAIGHNGYANFYLTDQVDSVKLVTDNDGTAITRFEYLPYGESWFTEGEQKNAPKYNSQELDKETGYYYYNARHYDPEIARFITADGIIDNERSTQGWNRYAYVKGNPIRYSDPTGNVLESGWDLINVGMGAASFADNMSEGNYGWAALDAGGLVLDVGGLLFPGVPAGASMFLKVTRFGKAASYAGKMLKKGKWIEAGFDAIKEGRPLKGPIGDKIKSAFRRQARNFFKNPGNKNSAISDAIKKYGKKIEIHHRVPLEWAHKMGKNWNPNDVSNLRGVPKEHHKKISNAWKQFAKQFEGKKPPTKKQIQDFAEKLDKKFGDKMIKDNPAKKSPKSKPDPKSKKTKKE